MSEKNLTSIAMYAANDYPETEDSILMSVDNEFVTGWFDLHEEEYYTHEGEMIEDIDGWIWKPIARIGSIKQ